MHWSFVKKDYGCWIFTLYFRDISIELWQPEYWYKPWKWRIGFHLDFSNFTVGISLGFIRFNTYRWG